MNRPPVRNEPGWNSALQQGHQRYLEVHSAGAATRARFELLRASLARAMGPASGALAVADVGCGAGTQCRLWAQHGHQVFGVDMNKALIALARKRARESGLVIDYKVATATILPWPDQSMDLCIVPELLERVADWRACLAECVRVLRPGGALFLSTSNMLCPVQQEFDLPLYSWYPGCVKRHYEDLACTTRPELTGYATNPTVNWFTFYGLRKHLARHGMHCLDRFDVHDTVRSAWPVRALVGLVRRLPPLRFIAHCLTPRTVVLAFKPQA